MWFSILEIYERTDKRITDTLFAIVDPSSGGEVMGSIEL